MRKIAFLLLAAAFADGALAAAADQVSVDDPYVRQAPPGALATGAFMVLRNGGDKDVKLLKAGSPAARVTEMHSHVNEGGVMKMRPVAAIDIKAKGEAVLQPGGLHLMLIDLKGALKEGETVPITLEFDDRSSMKVEAKVLRPGMSMPMEHHH